MTFNRFALYYVPPHDADWAQFATNWLGWDVFKGRAVAHPQTGLPVADITATPRKYGLHATIKPPFRLQTGYSQPDLEQAVWDLCQTLSPVHLDGLHLAQLGRFLALRPVGDTTALNALAARCVETLDPCRAPATEAELTKRRAANLSPRQDQNLIQWGYPYVMEDFNFHITLSGRLPKPDLAAVRDYLDTKLTPRLPIPFTLADLALVGEDDKGRFHMIHRYTLSDK